MRVYFDTNIYLYLINSSSVFHDECKTLLKYCQANNVQIVTSVETIQEIIHYAKNIKQLEMGIDAAYLVMHISDELVPFTHQVLTAYLENVATYLSPSSQDLLHYSTCQVEDIKTVITYDRDFNKFKQIEATTPHQFLP